MKDLLVEESITLRGLSRKSDVRHSALSEFANQKRENVHLAHLEKIADALEIDDIRKILTIEVIEED
ncbi:helix-turn-helix domain-containing protein [Neobacillus sp. K501]